jgi:hypothetical protein
MTEEEKRIFEIKVKGDTKKTVFFQKQETRR